MPHTKHKAVSLENIKSNPDQSKRKLAGKFMPTRPKGGLKIKRISTRKRSK